MPGVKRKVSTTSFNGTLQSNLGIAPVGGKRAKIVTRKEKRKSERIKKRKPSSQERSVVRKEKAAVTFSRSTVSLSKALPPSSSAGQKEEKKHKGKDEKKKHRGVSSEKKGIPSNFISAVEDPEDLEIARLEKLLGVSSKGKNKEKSASKLNKEFEMYEGIGGKFGDFLMQLDDFAQYAKSDSSLGDRKSFLEGGAEVDSDSDHEVRDVVPRLLNDSDQEASDVDMDNDSNDGSEEEGSSEEEESDIEEGEGWFDDASEYAVPAECNENESEGDSEDGSDDESLDEEEDPDHAAGSTYRPVLGEDIYGRTLPTLSASTAPGRYLPPALRKKLEEDAASATATADNGDGKRSCVGGGSSSAKGSVRLAAIDENSEQTRMVRRQINGLLNRLSEQSRDSIVQGLREVFSSNSFTLCCHLLRDCLLSVCSNATQLMSTLIPHYSGLVAALHFSVDFQIGSFVLESLVVKLSELLREDDKRALTNEGGKKCEDDHSLISNKTAANLLLIVCHLYNLRVVHHGLVKDLFFLLIHEHEHDSGGCSLTTLRVELIVCLVQTSGQGLRGDDPAGLKHGVLKVMKMTQNDQDEAAVADKGRVKFMLEALSDLKNNKSSSRRQQSAQQESVQHMRKWIGRVKASAAGSGGGTSGDACLHIPLSDFLQAESRGRWWRAGASWGGHCQQDQDRSRDRLKQQAATGGARGSGASAETTPDEEKALLKVAKKLGMNTDTRKQIFLVVMSSRDVTDAFERLARLELRGKQDREVARVLCECCGSEKVYNEFYPELAALFCSQNRQYKITLQYAFWDLFKTLSEEQEGSKQRRDRRAINMARMLAHLTLNFHLSLSVLKVIDISELSSGLLLFLATYFMSLFSAKISSETFSSILDRVATTGDCLAVREFVLIFLQSHFKTLPSGLDPAETRLMERRRKETLRTMEAMSVLDIAQGVAEKDNEKGGRQNQFDDF